MYGGYPVTSEYDPRGLHGRNHHGTDIGCPQGTPLFVRRDSILHRAEAHSIYGWYYDVYESKGGVSYRLAHLSARHFSSGTLVPAGTCIALSGGREGSPGAGNSRGSHLHAELRINGELVNPESEPTLLEAIFSEGVELTKDDIRDLFEYELGQRDIMLGNRLKNAAEAAPEASTTRAVLTRMADAHLGTGEKNLEEGRD